MKTELSFEMPTGGLLRLQPDLLVFAAFASRDPAAGEHHRVELAERGVLVPERAPWFYPGVTATLSQAEQIATQGRRLVPEVEFAVIRAGTRRFVTVGCDLFDEEVERTDIERSKAVCATPIASKVLPLDGLADWDDFRIWMRCDGKLLQAGKMGELMEPNRLLELGLAGSDPARQALVYSGTLPFLEPIGRVPTEIEIGLQGAEPDQLITHRFRLAPR